MGREQDYVAWERQKGESARAFSAFTEYRDTAPAERSIQRCARARWGDKYTKARGQQWERWSARHQWVSRAQAWDEERDRVKRAADLAGIEDMQRRHSEVAALLLEVVRLSIERMLARMEKEPELMLDMSQAANIASAAASLERVARGVPETIMQELGEPAEQVVTVVWGDELPDQEDEDEEDPDWDFSPKNQAGVS